MVRKNKVGKKTIITIMMSIMLIMLMAFGGSMSAFAASLTVGSSSWSATAKAQSKSVSVSASSTSWTVTDPSATWIYACRSGSYSTRITLQANTTASARSASVRVYCGGINRYITVRQAANTLTVSSTAYSVAAAGGSKNVTVTAGCGSYSVTDNASWITTSKSGSTITITAAANLTGASRSGKVTVTSGSLTRTVTVTQAAHTLTLGASTVSPGAKSTSYTISVTSSYGSWTATSNVSWASTVRTGNTFIVYINANTAASSRTGTVTVNAGGTKKNVTINQAANVVTLSSSSGSFAAGGASKSITATATTGTITASCNYSWVTTSVSGSTVTIKAAANLTGAARSCSVTVRAGGGAYKTYIVSQAAHSLTLGASTVSPTPEYLSYTIDVTSSYGSWTVTANNDWLSTVRTGNTFIVYVSENNTGSKRTGTVTVSGGGVSRTLTVNQSAEELTINDTALNPDGAAQSYSIYVTSKYGSWVVDSVSGDGWLKAVRTGNTVTISMSKNTTGAQRVGVVKLKSMGTTGTITVTQGKLRCIINFDPTYGTLSSGKVRTVYYGDEIGTLPTPTAPDAPYTFGGWYTAKTGGTKITASTIADSSTTYYARWIGEEYEIIYQWIDPDDPYNPVEILPTETYSFGDELKITSQHPDIVGKNLVKWEVTIVNRNGANVEFDAAAGQTFEADGLFYSKDTDGITVLAYGTIICRAIIESSEMARESFEFDFDTGEYPVYSRNIMANEIQWVRWYASQCAYFDLTCNNSAVNVTLCYLNGNPVPAYENETYNPSYLMTSGEYLIKVTSKVDTTYSFTLKEHVDKISTNSSTVWRYNETDSSIYTNVAHVYISGNDLGKFVTTYSLANKLNKSEAGYNWKEAGKETAIFALTEATLYVIGEAATDLVEKNVIVKVAGYAFDAVQIFCSGLPTDDPVNMYEELMTLPHIGLSTKTTSEAYAFVDDDGVVQAVENVSYNVYSFKSGIQFKYNTATGELIGGVSIWNGGEIEGESGCVGTFTQPDYSILNYIK